MTIQDTGRIGGNRKGNRSVQPVLEVPSGDQETGTHDLLDRRNCCHWTRALDCCFSRKAIRHRRRSLGGSLPLPCPSDLLLDFPQQRRSLSGRLRPVPAGRVRVPRMPAGEGMSHQLHNIARISVRGSWGLSAPARDAHRDAPGGHQRDSGLDLDRARWTRSLRPLAAGSPSSSVSSRSLSRGVSSTTAVVSRPRRRFRAPSPRQACAPLRSGPRRSAPRGYGAL
jgi:hypothetical protein